MSTQPQGHESGSSPQHSLPTEGLNPLSMLSELESRIAGLKKMHEGTAARETVLSARELEIAERERAHAARVEQLTTREREITDLAKELSGQQDQIRQQQGTIQRALEELAAQRQIAQSERERADRESQQRREAADAAAQSSREEVDRQASAIAERERAMGERESRLSDRERELAQRDKALSEKDASIAHKDHELKELTERIDGLESELDRRDAHIREAEMKAAEREKWLVELESSIERRKSEAQSTASAAEALENELMQRDERLSARERDLESREKSMAELAVRQKALEALQAQLDEQQGDLRAQRASLDREKAEVLERERALTTTSFSEETSAIYAGRVEELQLKLGEASAGRASLQSELEQMREELAGYRQKLEAASSRPSMDDLEQERRSCEDLRRALEQSQDAEQSNKARVRELEARVDDLSVKAAAAREAEALSEENYKLKRELGSRDEALNKQQGELGALRTEAQRLTAQLAEAQEKAGRNTGAGVDKVEIEKRDQAIVLLKQRSDKLQELNASLNAELREARDQAAALREQAESGTSAGRGEGVNAGAIGERAATRQARLKRYKKLLQVQARKIVAAQAALQKRHTDCEQILSQRARIVAQSEDVTRREKRLANSKVRTGAAAALTYCVATLGLVAGLSWEVSKRVWPGTYVSRAVLEAETRDRRVSPEQVVQWQSDMEQLVHDPRLMEVVAERMKRRGIESLSSAADVRSMVQDTVYTQSSQPGVLEIEHRGEGRERSQMELDTLVTAFKSVADESKGERTHDLGVLISSAAKASESPLIDERLRQAGMIFGGGVVLVGVLGGVIYSRLAASKRAFDAKAARDEGGDVDWATLEATFKKSAGTQSERRAA